MNKKCKAFFRYCFASKEKTQEVCMVGILKNMW